MSDLSEVGSKWRSKRNGRVATVNNVCADHESCGVQLRFDNPPRLRWVALTPSGSPCGYEPVEEVKP